MTSQTHRMQNLIEDLLVLSRIEASSERIYETWSIFYSASQVEEKTQALNKEKNHKINFHIDEELYVLA